MATDAPLAAVRVTVEVDGGGGGGGGVPLIAAEHDSAATTASGGVGTAGGGDGEVRLPVHSLSASPSPSRGTLLRRSMERGVSAVLQRLPSLRAASGVQAEFYCVVCMSNHVTADAVTLSACGHRLCRSCAEAWVASEVGARRIELACIYDAAADMSLPPAAPAHADDAGFRPSRGGTCGAALTAADVEAALAAQPAALERYRRFRLEAEQPNLRRCPYAGCGHAQTGAAATPAMTCGACGKVYCFNHANAHVGSTCAAYERATTLRVRTAAGRRGAAAAAPAAIKHCPGCGIPTERVSGCATMQCHVGACRTTWCWHCGDAILPGELPAHFAYFNLASPCAGRQLSNLPPSCAYRVFQWVVGGLTLAVLGPPAAVILAAALLVFFPCTLWVACRAKRPAAMVYEAWMTVINNMLLLLLLPVVIAGAALASCLGLVAVLLFPFWFALRALLRRGGCLSPPPPPQHEPRVATGAAAYRAPIRAAPARAAAAPPAKVVAY